MRKEQYLEAYGFTIPFTDGILSFYDKPEVELSVKGKIIAKGKVTDIRFCEDGELRIISHENKTDFLAFEMEINGEYYGPFNSHIKTPPEDEREFAKWVKESEKIIKQNDKRRI